jgi:hypothetical protein
MPDRMKRVLFWLLFGFVVYAIVSNPDGAADIVASIWDIIADGFRNIGRFFEAIVGNDQ